MNIRQPNDENRDLTDSNDIQLFQNKPYTPIECGIHAYTCLCHPLLCFRDEFRAAVQEGKYIIDTPLIAFRADTRPPEEVFTGGFSAYAFSRMPICPNYSNCTTCIPKAYSKFMEQERDEIKADIIFCLCCSPIFVPIMALHKAFSALSCILQGNSTYDGYYVSRWPALALTTNFNYANVWRGLNLSSTYRYCVYLNGAVSFSQFSRDGENSYPGTYDRGQDVYDAKEVFPKNLDDQTVDASQIICVQIPSEESAHDKITLAFNPDFNGFNAIKSGLDTRGLLAAKPFPVLELANNKETIDNLFAYIGSQLKKYQERQKSSNVSHSNLFYHSISASAARSQEEQMLKHVGASSNSSSL
jgi:hypothetical protein